jgi:PAS domain S-box-containing protein
MVAVLWAALSGRFARGNEMFYLLFPPLIWVAVRRGLRGATAAILALDTGLIVALRIYPRSPAELTLLQFLMLILSLAGLVLGALISERDAGEQRLSQEEARLRLLMESTGEAIYGVDNNGECIFCNHAMLRLLRFSSQADVLGRNIHDVMHHTRRDGTPYPRDECSMQKNFLGGRKFHEADELLWRADGTSFRRIPAYTPERYSGLVQNRGRQTRARNRGHVRGRLHRGCPRAAGTECPAEGHRTCLEYR